MEHKKLSFSLRKYLRRKKGEIRKEIRDGAESAKKITELVASIRKLYPNKNNAV